MFDFCVHVLTLTCIFALMALSLNIQAGYAGLLNFGYIAFVGIGAYAVGLGHMAGWPLALSVIVGMVVSMALSWGIARLSGQLAADYWGIATLAIAEIIRIIALNQSQITGGAQGIGSLPSPVDMMPLPMQNPVFLVLGLICVGLVAWMVSKLAGSRFGRALRLMREQPQLASCLGYDIRGLKSRAMMSGSVLAAFAGALLACYTHYVSPDYLLATQTFLVWSMVMIGGIGTVPGVLAGSLLVQVVYSFVPFVQDYLSISPDISGALRLGLVGLILLLCLLWRTSGLLPERPRRIR